MRLEHWFYTVPLRVRALFRRRQVEQELDEELQFHLEHSISRYIAQGLSADEARYTALRDMGGLEQRKEQCRDARGVSLIENFIQDVRYGCRMLRKTPGFTAAAVLILGLGIGANTAIFSVVNTVLLQPLQYPRADRMVQILLSSPAWAAGQKTNVASIPEFITWREQQQVFELVAAYNRGSAVNLTGGKRPEQVKALRVSASYFRLFGANAQLGRTFSEDEDRPGGPRVLVISDGLWLRRFAGDPVIVGKTLLIGDEPWEIAGVVAPGFTPEIPADIFLPLQADPASTNPGHSIRVAALLRPGVPLSAVNADLRVTYQQFRRKHPEWFTSAEPTEEMFVAEPLGDVLVGNARPALHVLFGAVAFVLLIACANVANLLLARATSRRREMAIRTALGAGAGRIASQLLAESVLLSLAGGLLGSAIGYMGVRLLMSINPGNIPRVGLNGSAVVLDSSVMIFTLGVSVFTGILFGSLPAFTASRTGISAAFKASGSQSGRSLSHKRTHSILVVTEVALAFILLVGSALMIRSLRSLLSVDTGFDARNVLTMEMSLAGSRFQTPSEVADLIRDAERRVEALPNVVALAATFSLPLEHRFGGLLTIEALPDTTFGADACYVSGKYFDVFGIPVLRGRSFTDTDKERSSPVMLVNQQMTQGSSGNFTWSSPLVWPGGEPIGQRLTLAKNMGPIEDATREIIGVVGNVRDTRLETTPQPNIYIPIAQLTTHTLKHASGMPLAWVIRTTTDPYSLASNIERELRTASGGLPVGKIRSMQQVVATSTARTSFNMALLSVFACVALILAATGIYSVLAYSVQQRKQEIGIRIALGAGPVEVRRMVVQQGLRLALLGVVAGVMGSLWLAGLMRDLIYGVQESDPIVLTTVAILLTTVAALAVYVPARRATKVNPILALRWE